MTAAALCGALDDCTPEQRDRIAERLGRRNAFAYVKRRATPDEARRVAELGLSGVGFLTENRRYYPNGTLAAHLLGYVGVDNQGLSGIESTLDSEISGDTGQVLVQTDARRQAFSRIERPPTGGATIELTIDAQLQHIVERELRAGIEAHNADAGAIVMLDPRNGDILALASEPTFNPNAFSDATPEQRRNRAVQDLFEPGSTFKVVTASAALEERVVDRDDVVRRERRFDSRRRRPDPRLQAEPPVDIHRRHCPVEQRRCDHGGAAARAGAAQPLRPPIRVRAGALAGLSVRKFRPRLEPGIAHQASHRVDRDGLPDRGDAAAGGGGGRGSGERGRTDRARLVRATVGPDGRKERDRRVIRRAISRQTAAELTDIMRQVVERGTGATRASRASRSPARPEPRKS